jgi:aspartyl-tRNA(Asn)/glutamyl-tRNA(Gln) amidotransferase subunit B
MNKGMIGLEVHAYLVTKEKLFCKCRASRKKGLRKNINICPICTGQPGSKPMLPNGEAVKQAIRIGLMLGCKINNDWEWQRKHYSWPDMPKGFQNTISGNVSGVGVNGEFHNIGIWSMHLEEDPASWDPESGCVDYNRSGLPLVEIITAPDFTSSEQVMGWLKRLVHSLSYLKAVDSNAGIKVDVNVNIPGKTERVEIKNISSVEAIGGAIEYELERQLREGSVRETRRFDSVKGKTVRMRGKEDAEDYRFISDPDLQDVVLGKKFVSDLEKTIPDSPEEKLNRMIKKFKIKGKDAAVLTKHLDIAEFYESVIEKGIDAKFALPWVTIELLRFLNYNKTSLDGVDMKVEHFVELLGMVKKGNITPLQAKGILNKFYPKSFSPFKAGGKISSESELRKVASAVIGANAKAVGDYRGGDKNAFNFLMGQIMKKTERRADFVVARKVLEKLLK